MARNLMSQAQTVVWLVLMLFQCDEAAAARKRVLVIGGSGRVGGSAVRSLLERYNTDIDVTVGGRSADKWEAFRSSPGKKRFFDHHPVQFCPMDITNTAILQQELSTYDLIVNTAGPFQGLKVPSVMECALRSGKIYLDVCDDIALSRIARSDIYQEIARQYGGTAVISTGIWPGCSSLLAEQMIEDMALEWSHSYTSPQEEKSAIAVDSKPTFAATQRTESGTRTAPMEDPVDTVRFTFFTAGSGGAGPTILTATFLILGEDVVTYCNGEETLKKSASDAFTVDFGPSIGMREVARLNLIECESCRASSKALNVETFFGTAPPIWNKLFVVMANLIPQDVLKNRDAMALLAQVSLPMVRLVDSIVGSKNAIRVDITTASGRQRTGLLSHEDLEKCVGDAIGAFAVQLLTDPARSPSPDVISPAPAWESKDDKCDPADAEAGAAAGVTLAVKPQQKAFVKGGLKGVEEAGDGKGKGIPPGVYFPEEVPVASFRRAILEDISACSGTIFYSSNWSTPVADS